MHILDECKKHFYDTCRCGAQIRARSIRLCKNDAATITYLCRACGHYTSRSVTLDMAVDIIG